VRQTWTSRDGKHHQALGFDMFRVQDRGTLGCGWLTLTPWVRLFWIGQLA